MNTDPKETTRVNGLDAQTATLISALFPLGGCGAILLGWLIGNRMIAAGYGLTAVSIYAIGMTGASNLGRLMLLVFIAGVLMNAAQVSMPALAAAFYPTRGRATGVAWMLAIGRFGGIAGSFLVAELSRQSLSFGEIFSVVALPGVIAMAALLIKQFAEPSMEVPYVPVRRAPSTH